MYLQFGMMTQLRGGRVRVGKGMMTQLREGLESERYHNMLRNLNKYKILVYVSNKVHGERVACSYTSCSC